MAEIDRVFSRFQEDKPATDRREMLTIPRRGGATGSRVVEVVHVRSAAPAAEKPRLRRPDAHLRAATWEGGFPARQIAPIAVPEDPFEAAAPAPEPTAHVMPMWEPAIPEPALVEPAIAPPAKVEIEDSARPARRPRAAAHERHYADPFNAADEGANCMRCGYAVEPARERRGLLTCASCG